MYSFYRAWLMRDAFSSTIGNPPDVVVQVGPGATQFAAHRALLISHSGYFKSVCSQSTNPIILSNIGVAEFTSLLTWMYTGFLDLNLDNIYNILLATHLLHMPGALEICRNFLIQNNHNVLQETRINAINIPNANNPSIFSSHHHPNIVKPIPSRKLLPPDLFRIDPTLAKPTVLKSAENTSFQKIESDPNNPTQSTKPSEPENKTASPKPSTSFRRSPSPTIDPIRQSSCSPQLSETSDKVVIQYRSKTSTTKKSNSNTKKTKLVKEKLVLKSSEPIIVDIACCDGPVRFHRVLNNCYGQTNVIAEKGTETKTKTDIMNKIMTENINRDENNRKQKKLLTKQSDDLEPNGAKPQSEENNQNNSNSDVFYTCVYCNHTFKSQYCYQKHARRHINPITLNSTCGSLDSAKNKTVMSTTTTTTTSAAATNCLEVAKREVKLLDMNVQYYPCKTCGSKFPSYYFVHKHRKMYHADEMVGEKEPVNVESNNVDVTSHENNQQETPSPMESTDKK